LTDFSVLSEKDISVLCFILFSVVEETLFVSLKKEIISLVSSPEKREEEIIIIKRMKYLASRTQEEWEIPSSIISPQQWSSAVFELAGIERNPTPTRRLNALVRTAKAIYAEFKDYVLPRLREEGKGDTVLSADDLVPIFIFVLCQSRLRHPLLNRDLLWSDISHPDLRHGECGYYLTTYELAIQAIQDLEVDVDGASSVGFEDDVDDDDYSTLRSFDNILERSRNANIGILRAIPTSVAI
jgi:hypothetical protein